jgi:hypothetical protein
MEPFSAGTLLQLAINFGMDCLNHVRTGFFEGFGVSASQKLLAKVKNFLRSKVGFQQLPQTEQEVYDLALIITNKAQETPEVRSEFEEILAAIQELKEFGKAVAVNQSMTGNQIQQTVGHADGDVVAGPQIKFR